MSTGQLMFNLCDCGLLSGTRRSFLDSVLSRLLVAEWAKGNPDHAVLSNIRNHDRFLIWSRDALDLVFESTGRSGRVFGGYDRR